jgi:hypothetical protein
MNLFKLTNYVIKEKCIFAKMNGTEYEMHNTMCNTSECKTIQREIE